MAVTYNKLWKLLIDKKMKKTELMEAASIGTTTLSKLGKDQFVSMDVLVKICKVLECNIGDIVDYIADEE
jgi:DNA-binding Xre family transcriptional regulator